MRGRLTAAGSDDVTTGAAHRPTSGGGSPHPPPYVALAGDIHGERQRDQAQVEHQTLTLQVQPVEPPRGTRRRPGQQLRQPGDARVRREPPVMRRVVPAEPLDVLLSQRSRSDDAHFTSQHIDELRKLVDAGATQPASDTRDPLLAHAAQLEDREDVTLASDPRLREERRTAVLQPGRESDA